VNTRILDSEPIVEDSTGINVDLLNKVADHIEQRHEEFDMEHWQWKRKPSVLTKILWYLRDEGMPFCGTTRCIAGWSCVLAGTKAENTPATAQRLLGLNLEQAQRLFYLNNWPKRFRDQYDGGRRYTDAGAWVAAERIRHFIATNGAE
jgi:hypothetical protein